jgi:serine protease Do
VVAQLKQHGRVDRGWLGVQVQAVTKELAAKLILKKADGALVAQVQPQSPALTVGIEAGAAVDGRPVKDGHDLARKIGALPPNATVSLSIVRKGSEKIVALTLGRLPGSH